MDKKELRAQIKEKKRAMTAEEIEKASDRLAKRLFATKMYQQAETIYGYLSYNQEVRTAPILEQALRDGKRVAVPKVYDDEMRFVYWDTQTPVRPGYGAIPEPVEPVQVAQEPGALVLMPGLAFDKQGNRMGYGGGFYDRFLMQEPEHPTVALCYDFQLVESIPTDSYDIPVQLVLWDIKE